MVARLLAVGDPKHPTRKRLTGELIGSPMAVRLAILADRHRLFLGTHHCDAWMRALRFVVHQIPPCRGRIGAVATVVKRAAATLSCPEGCPQPPPRV